MTDPHAIARSLSRALRRALDNVCRTNGGGVSVRCRVGDDGYGVPINGPMRKLFEKGLIQGKAGAYEKVVHTRLGLAVRAIIEEEGI